MRFTTLAILAVGIAAPFAVANAQQAPQGYGPPQGYEQGPPPGYQGQAPQGYDQGQNDRQDRKALRHLLSHEQRAMLKQELQSQGTSGRGQIKQAMREHLQQLASMSPQQQAQMRNELQQEWNALPAAQKQEIEQRIAEKREERHERRQGQSGQQQPGQQQYGPQQYGPQQGPQYAAPHASRDGDDEDDGED